jgi:hypothetical protein
VNPAAGPQQQPAVPAPATPTDVTAKATPNPKGPPPKAAPHLGDGQVLADGRTTAELLKQMLPAGLTTSKYSGQDSYLPSQWGVSTFGFMGVDDGHGIGGIGVNIQQNSPTTAADQTCGARSGEGATSCDSHKLSDGSTILVYEYADNTPVGGAGPAAGSVHRVADLLRLDGVRIVIDVTNYLNDPTVEKAKGWSISPTRSEPALSLDQLATIVENSRWTLTVPSTLEAQAKKDLVPYVDMTQKN